MTNTLALANTQLTMTSREIAELVNSRHDSVKRSMERMQLNGVIRFTPTVETSHEGAGARDAFVYLVNKRDSYVVVAQLSPEFTAALVDRWQELEAQVAAPAIPNFADPAASARAWADQFEQRQKVEQALQLAAPKAEFVDRYVDGHGLRGVREVSKLLKVGQKEFVE